MNPLQLRSILSISICLMLAWGCKKHRFEGDKEILLGRWHWDHTILDCGSAGECYSDSTNHPIYEQRNIRFAKKNWLELYRPNGELIDEDKIRIVEWKKYDEPSSLLYRFELKFNGAIIKQRFTGHFLRSSGNDTLYVDNWPVSSQGENIVRYNLFVRR